MRSGRLRGAGAPVAFALPAAQAEGEDQRHHRDGAAEAAVVLVLGDNARCGD